MGSRAYLPPGGSPGGSRRSDSRLIVLRTTPRVAPGLLSLPAWQVLRAAGQVLAGSPGHPQLAALEQAGIGWELAPEEAAAARATRLIALASTCDAPVVWLAAPTGEDDLLTALAEAAFDTEVLSGSHDLPGGRLLDLVAAMDTLRTDCPWDAEQTHRSLAPHLIEESYEALEALESGDARDLRDELGDVLLQVVFHARIAAERNDGTGFTIDDVADAIVGKLVRRHPHVFGDVRVSGADEVKANWAAIKAAERAESRGRPGSALDGIPFGQPALSLAAQLHARAAAAGAHPDLAAPNQAGQGNEIGARLLALVAEAGGAGLNPELELRAAARRFADGVRAWERENAPGVD